MDLIIGLPNESMSEILDSVEKVLRLKPDNLTVHALALKRGSVYQEENCLLENKLDWKNIRDKAEKKILDSGYQP